MKNSNNAHSGQLTANELHFRQRFPKLENVYKAFGPSSWRYALEHVDKAVQMTAPSLNRLNLIYHTVDADTTLFMKHFAAYYLMAERSSKPLGEEVCKSAAALFLGRNGTECTPIKLLCYFANYSVLKDSFRELDPEDIIVQYSKKFRVWWGNQIARYFNIGKKVQAGSSQPCGIYALRLVVREWLEEGGDPREHTLYKAMHIVTDKMIEEVRKEMVSGVF